MILGVLQPFWCSLSCGIRLSPRFRNLKYARYKSGRATPEGIALTLMALLIFLLNRKYGQSSQHPAAVADDFGTTSGNGKAEMDSESKAIAAISYIPVSSQEKPSVAPTGGTSTADATMSEGPPISPTTIPAELSQDTSATVTSPHQELPAYYAAF
jgi:hypothetical protein